MYIDDTANDLSTLQTKIGLFSGNNLSGAPITGWLQYLSIPMNGSGNYPAVIAFNNLSSVYIGKSDDWTRLATSSDISSLKSNFQDGCSTIASSITSNGVSTASNASPSTMATNISTLATNKYNAGVASITGVTLSESLTSTPGSTYSNCSLTTTSYHHLIIVTGRYNGNYSTPVCSSGNTFTAIFTSNSSSEGSGIFDGYYLGVPSGTTIRLNSSSGYQSLRLNCFNLS